MILLDSEGSFEETVPVHGRMQNVTRPCRVEAAFRWVKGYDATLVSFVNTIPTPDGGTHVAGFERAFSWVVNDALQLGEARKLKKFGDEARATRDDVQEGLVAVLKVTVPEPQFRGQTKRELGTPAVQRIVYDAIKSGLTDWFERGRKGQVEAVRTKIVTAVELRLTQRQQRETLRRASSLGSGGMPAKLADCRTTDVAASELLIVEGDSAAGPAKQGRDSEIQAVLPIRGKIINAGKSTLKQVLDNAEAEAIFTALGAGSGAGFDPAACRYGRVVILADADVDGSHIRCLLLTLFFHYTRPLLEQGRVYVAMPPLYTVREGGRGGAAPPLLRRGRARPGAGSPGGGRGSLHDHPQQGPRRDGRGRAGQHHARPRHPGAAPGDDGRRRRRRRRRPTPSRCSWARTSSPARPTSWSTRPSSTGKPSTSDRPGVGGRPAPAGRPRISPAHPVRMAANPRSALFERPADAERCRSTLSTHGGRRAP